jgi:general secretion pathway protein M
MSTKLVAGKLSPAASRSAALAILFALVGVLYLGLVSPIIDGYQSLRGETAQTEDQLARYRRAARERAPRQAELTALEQRSTSADGFLTGANDTLVAVQIQNRLKSLTDAATGTLRSTQVLPPQDEGARRRIIVRGQLSITVAGALKVFHDLEADNPTLFVDNLDIRARSVDAREYRARGNSEDSSVVDVQFDVYGYTHGGK